MLSTNPMIDFQLIRKKPEILELRAYLHQLIILDLGLSKALLSELTLFFKDGVLERGCLEKLSYSELEFILNKWMIFPEEVFFFKNQFDPANVDSKDYTSFPVIFSGIHQVSFDKGGLLCVEYFHHQIYQLFSSSGKALTELAHDLDLGLEGLVLFRGCSSNDEAWRLYQYDGFKIDLLEDDQNIFYPEPDRFPGISGRDIIPEMFPLGEFPIPLGYPPANLNPEEFRLELEKFPYFYRWLHTYFINDENLALLAIKKNYLAFTLLGKELRNNKKFVLRLLSDSEVDQSVYWYLEHSLRVDKEVKGSLKLNEGNKLDIDFIELGEDEDFPF